MALLVNLLSRQAESNVQSDRDVAFPPFVLLPTCSRFTAPLSRSLFHLTDFVSNPRQVEPIACQVSELGPGLPLMDTLTAVHVRSIVCLFVCRKCQREP